jgi:hypothetical protein
MASPGIRVPNDRSLFEGTWTYRSYLNNPDPNVRPNDLLFGLADILLQEADDGTLTGTLGGSGWSLSLAGAAEYADGAATAKFQGTGAIGGEAWVYDYFAYHSPVWENGIVQVPALLGAVVRTEPHGSAQAGFTAQFIAVRKS